jgi:peroxiredoxin
MKQLLTGFLLLSVTAFAQHAPSPVVTGTWNGTAISHGQPVPFTLTITGTGTSLKAALINGSASFSDQPQASSVTLDGNHLVVAFNYFTSKIDGRVTGGTLTGTFSTATAKYPLTARLASTPTVVKAAPNSPDIHGDWEIAYKSVKDESAWQLRVTPEASDPARVKAVIQRIDGDTGSLYGVWNGKNYAVSHFTAAGPLLYTLTPQADGTMLVSNMLHADLKTDRQQDLVARRPAEARKENLPAPTDTAEQTTVKDPTVPFAFSFPDLSGKLVSNTDPRFDGKVVIVAIGGSWCPNCHDEAPFLVSLYKQFHSQGLEIVNLSFEDESQLKDLSGLHAFVARYNIPYTVLVAGNTDQLNEKIPQGVHLNSWPTTFFLGRDGLVKEVHAGFAGPANPAANEALKHEVTDLIEHLLSEPAPVRSASLKP